ncbi:MAG: hypothetical protein ACOZCL_08660 [Bacillota bacterium]
MFYPELSKIDNYKYFSEIIDTLDIWLATLPISEQDKITAAKFSSKYQIDYDIAEILLEKCCSLEILTKQYAIKCPSCEHILKISTEQDLIDNLSNTVSCYNCDETNLHITPDDISIIYKLVRKPTNSPDKIKRLMMDSLGVEQPPSRISTLGEHIEKDLSKVNDFFFNPTEDKKNQLKKLFEDLTSEYQTTKQKGDSLEKLAIDLLNSVKCFTATKEISTPTNQIDCTIKNTVALSPSIFDEIGCFFIAECKNEKKKSNNTYYHKLNSILMQIGGKFGILFSYSDATSTCGVLAREFFLSNKTIIINVNSTDMKKIIFEGRNFLDIIHSKIMSVKINPTKSLEETCLFEHDQ